jgi:hypothetical protein
MSRDDAAYWQLVEQLMRFGWYRDGSDDGHDAGGRGWRFREGHTTDGRSGGMLRITAPDEAAAMRILLEELQRANAAKRRPEIADHTPADGSQGDGC